MQYRRNVALKLLAMWNVGNVGSGKSGAMKTMMKIFFPEALFPTKKNTVKLLKKLTGKNFHVFTGTPLVLDHWCYLLKGFNNMAMAYHAVDGFSDAEIESIREKALYLVGDDDPFAQLGGKTQFCNTR